MNWDPDIVPEKQPLTLLALVFVALRGLMIVLVIYTLLPVLIVVRLVETPLNRRPISPLIVQLACRVTLFILCLKVTIKGAPMIQKGAVVANHASWLDIFVLNALHRVYFVSKSEVGNWPLVGFIARAVGTVFIKRKSGDAAKQKSQFEQRLDQGDRLLFFPEGTSTDTLRVLPFKSSLFAAFFSPQLVGEMWIQPTTLSYKAPKGQDRRFYGYWGDMSFADHFLKTLGTPRAGAVTVHFHSPIKVGDYSDRKLLAAACEKVVSEHLETV